MSVLELKAAIIDKVGKLNEYELSLVNDFIKSINNSPSVKINTISHALDIINERVNVLEKLAQ